ncbi:cell wall hydrolase [Kaustia mangrovi]|uniref:Cell wall hydrolase n=1 Tax=Kaustia mangrovi TaxID=2593653 RepID=A0A7S8C826_9HYPH|nr:cell wall hydrolase [Kaustia mangrovi]QPC44931.1 cell wall hydrolase [Kaustia mangrovi]
MAQNDGRREVVKDPLAVSGREVSPERSLSLSGVRAPRPGSTSGAGSTAAQMSSAFDTLQSTFSNYVEDKKDDWIAEGKLAYMSGKTEADLLKNGNRFTHQGFLQLKVQDDVNRWYMQEAADIDAANSRMSPDEYQGYVASKRAAYLDTIEDPYAKKIAVAAFEQHAPALVKSQFVKNNEYEREQRINQFGETLRSLSQTSPVKSVVDENGPLKLAPKPVLPVMQSTKRDRDIGIRTILGEAANQGSTGMSAVAHVLRNRAVDGRWPKSIAGVALQDKQFSAWNSGAGGNGLVYKYGPGSAMYEKAGKVYDAVMSGRHVDPTGGATHYYSPRGMEALVGSGAQTNRLPNWLRSESARGGGVTKIGGHIFAGKARLPKSTRKLIELPEGVNDLNTVAQDEGVSVTGVKETGAANELQEYVFGTSNLNDSDKATALSSAMASDLAAGDDTLFRDAGGVSALIRLGASPKEINKVRRAEAAYQKKQLDQYDSAFEAWRADLIERASNGEDIDALRVEIEQKVEQGKLDDNEAQSLARNAANKARIAGSDSNLDGNVDYLTEIGGLYQQIKTGDLGFEDAAEQAKDIASRYGATEKETNNLIGRIHSIDQQRQDALRRDAEKAYKKHRANEKAKGDVDAAISRGYGLNTLSGSIDTVNNAGQKDSVSKKQYGVHAIKTKHMNAWREKQESGEVEKSEAIAGALRDTFKELQNHQVVDEQTQSQLVGSLTGNILTKDGSLTEDALQAYDTWQILRNTPEITKGYLSKTVGDDYVRGLLETAYILDSGNMTGGEALRKAHEIMNDELRDPDDRLSKDVVWRRKLDKGVNSILSGKDDTPWWQYVFGIDTPDTEVAQMERQKGRAMTYVQNRAEAYHLQNPNMDAKVSLNLALDDLENNATVVAGNVLVTSSGSLAEDMGIGQFGSDAPDEAITDFITKYGADIWPDEFDNHKEGWLDFAGRAALNFSPDATVRRDAPVYMSYNQDTGILTVDLYKDHETGELLGMPRHLDVKAIGQEYYDDKTEPSAWDDMWNSVFSLARPDNE